jgi:hypothetical protein
MAMEPDSVECPFTYQGIPSAQFGYLGATAFGVSGLMACPTEENGYDWQVFLDMEDAVVPQGDVSECLSFKALAVDYTEGYAAWQYT